MLWPRYRHLVRGSWRIKTMSQTVGYGVITAGACASSYQLKTQHSELKTALGDLEHRAVGRAQHLGAHAPQHILQITAAARPHHDQIDIVSGGGGDDRLGSRPGAHLAACRHAVLTQLAYRLVHDHMRDRAVVL